MLSWWRLQCPYQGLAYIFTTYPKGTAAAVIVVIFQSKKAKKNYNLVEICIELKTGIDVK